MKQVMWEVLSEVLVMDPLLWETVGRAESSVEWAPACRETELLLAVSFLKRAPAVGGPAVS